MQKIFIKSTPYIVSNLFYSFILFSTLYSIYSLSTLFGIKEYNKDGIVEFVILGITFTIMVIYLSCTKSITDKHKIQITTLVTPVEKQNASPHIKIPHGWIIPEWLIVISHAFIPLTFLIIGVISGMKIIALNWEFLSLGTILCIPFIFVLLCIYVKKIKIKDFEIMLQDTESSEWLDGLEQKEDKQTPPTVAPPPTSAPSSPTSAPSSPTSAPSPMVVAPNIPINSLSYPALKVLRTLWAYQRDLYGTGTNVQRWGFKIRAGIPDYPIFILGTSELKTHGLIVTNDKGMPFLSKIGMEYCNRNNHEIFRNNDIWNNFGAE